MVVASFAKEDLEHFFNLLKGVLRGRSVATALLACRFANQMSYTPDRYGGCMRGMTAGRTSSIFRGRIKAA